MNMCKSSMYLCIYYAVHSFHKKYTSIADNIIKYINYQLLQYMTFSLVVFCIIWFWTLIKICSVKNL